MVFFVTNNRMHFVHLFTSQNMYIWENIFQPKSSATNLH